MISGVIIPWQEIVACARGCAARWTKGVAVPVTQTIYGDLEWRRRRNERCRIGFRGSSLGSPATQWGQGPLVAAPFGPVKTSEARAHIWGQQLLPTNLFGRNWFRLVLRKLGGAAKKQGIAVVLRCVSVAELAAAFVMNIDYFAREGLSNHLCSWLSKWNSQLCSKIISHYWSLFINHQWQECDHLIIYWLPVCLCCH